MKYIDEFRDVGLAQNIVANIRCETEKGAGRSYRLMEFCGGHTHVLSRYGMSDLLPESIRMIHGPGCPICVLPIGRMDMAIRLALEAGVMLCAYGDCLRIPSSKGLSLIKAKANGGDIRMVYSPTDAVRWAAQHPEKQVVFLAVGFETTTPPTAAAILHAQTLRLTNFSVLCCHVLTPAAIKGVLETSKTTPQTPAHIDGFVGPAHVSTLIGSQPYEALAHSYKKPIVIAGFEPLDVMQAILMLVRQVNEGRAEVDNEFTRAVTRQGNLKAQALSQQVFEQRESFEWRGLGTLPHSALKLRPTFAAFDAEVRFGLSYTPVPDHKACECGAILRGHKPPHACKIFGTACTPENPVGSCMVSSEGACAAYYLYERHRGAP